MVCHLSLSALQNSLQYNLSALTKPACLGELLKSFWRLWELSSVCYCELTSSYNQTSDLCGMAPGDIFCFLVYFSECPKVSQNRPKVSPKRDCGKEYLTRMKQRDCGSAGRVSCLMIKRLAVQIPLYPSLPCPSARHLTLGCSQCGSAAHGVIQLTLSSHSFITCYTLDHPQLRSDTGSTRLAKHKNVKRTRCILCRCQHFH